MYAGHVRYNTSDCNVQDVKNIIKASFLLKLAYSSVKNTTKHTKKQRIICFAFVMYIIFFVF